MPIWVDADACPNVIKAILFRAAERTCTEVIFIANQHVNVPLSPFLKTLRVQKDYDAADNEIIRQVKPSDLVITADIPLAAAILGKGAAALSPRGECFSAATINARLVMRDFMETLRSSGVHGAGAATLSQKERQLFAGELDKWLQRSC